MCGYVNYVRTFLDNTLNLPVGEIARSLSLAPITLMVMLLSVPAGMATAIGSVAARSVLLARPPPDMRGQVVATQSLFQNIGALVPTLLAGLAADVLGGERGAVAIAVRPRGGGHRRAAGRSRNRGPDGRGRAGCPDHLPSCRRPPGEDQPRPAVDRAR